MRRGRFTLIRQHTAGDEGRLGLVVRIQLTGDAPRDLTKLEALLTEMQRPPMLVDYIGVRIRPKP